MANTARYIKGKARVERTEDGKVRLHLPDVVYSPGTGVEWQFVGPVTQAGIFSQFAGLMIEFEKQCKGGGDH